MKDKILIDGKYYSVESDGIYLQEMNNIFNESELALYKTLIDSETQILDVGGNIGLTSIFFIENGKFVQTVEPNTETFNFLVSNLSKFPSEKYQLFNFGLGSTNTKSIIFFPEANRASAFVSSNVEPHSEYIKESIQLFKLDFLLRKKIIRNFDFVKIDVEGFELEVIAGAKKTILKNRPIVTMEMNHFCLNAFRDVSVPQFINYLRKIFPLLFAVENRNYLDLHSQNDVYHVTWDHIVNGRFNTILAAFDESQVSTFRKSFQYGIG